MLKNGVASSTTITSGGRENIYSGGKAISAAIGSGGSQTVFSGGVASSSIVANGGVQTVASSGTASGTVISSGGTERILAGGTVTSMVVMSGGAIDVTSLTFSAGGTVSLNSTTDLLTITEGGTHTLQLSGSYSGDFFHLANDGNGGTLVTEDTTPCYCRGTRIRTPEGEIAVEDIKIGDSIMTADGKALPLKWIGRRSYCDWLAVGNAGVQPICFRAGSIADHVPMRDLLVSPEHAMFLDGMLIPAHHLVNGVSILKVEGMEEIEYFHLEFDRHVMIFAEGAAAESFADDDSRMLFHNADEYRRLYPNEPRGQYTEFCAPRVEAGAALDALHHTLATRAARLLPDGTAAEALLRQGYLDRATRTVVEGWAFAGAGEAPVKLAILVNGAVVGQTVADRYRAGLGFGDEHCSFRFALPQGLSTDASHRIEVRRESDWSPLTGGCVTLQPTAIGLP